MKQIILPILGLLLTTTVFTQTQPSYIPTSGLIAWYPFNGNANDESGNGNNGTVTGAAITTDRFGNNNKAYSFLNINDNISISSIVETNVLKYSVSGWFQKNSSSFNTEGNIFCGSNPAFINGLRFHIGSENQAAWGVENISSSVWSYSQNKNYADDNWHFFTVIFDASIGVVDSTELKIYIDTIEIPITQKIWGNQSNVTAPVTNSNLPTILGNITGGNDNFNGKLDDIGIWNRVLTQQEIINLYLVKTCTITPITNNVNLTGCDSIIYKGNIYHYSTTFTGTIKSIAGCDSIYNITQISILNSTKSYAYIFNIGTYPNYGTLSKINTANDSVEAIINTGIIADSLVGITIVPNKSKVYLSNYYQGKIYVVNTLTNSVDTIISLTGSFPRPYGIFSNPDGSKVFFIDTYNRNVTILNTTTNAIVATIPIPGSYSLNGVCSSPDGSRIYVTQNSYVYSIDAATNTISATIPIAGDPLGICTDFNGSKIFVGNRANNSIIVIDAITNNIITNITVGQYPRGLCINADGSKLYVANNGNYGTNGSISVINAITNTLIKNISVNSSPFGVSVTGDGKKLFVGLGYNTNCSNTESILIDALTDTIIKSIKLDSSCYGATAIGNFIVSSNIKKADTINLIGCDSVVHNAKIYKTSITIYDTLKNVLGCDSIYNAINIKIKPSSASSINITIAQSNLPYVWNGLTFTGAGTQTAHLINAVGCDSAATLNLTVLLPLNFINFSVTYINPNSNALSWATANEINVLNYILEFSLNGIGFETIEMVSAKNGVRNSYVFTHTLPKFTNNQILYYRIKGVDKDGKITYSEVKTIKYENSSFGDFVLAPNPAHEMIELYSGNTNVLLVISDIYGKQLKTIMVKNNLSRIDIGSLSKGIYFVSLLNDKNKVTKKLIVE